MTEAAMAKDIVIHAHNISKHYRLGVINHGTLYRDLQSWWAKIRGNPDPNATVGGAWSHSQSRVEGDLFRALEGISFDVSRGEIIGVIGGNGAGKSTLLKVLSRITAPTGGWIGLSGRVASLLEVGTGFHPELTGRENIYLNGAILGMSSREISRKFDEIVEFAEISQFIDTPVKRYSSGMYVRLAFSVAAHLESEILLVDEVLAVGDIAFQKKCLGKMEDIGSSGRTILFVSHNMAAIENLCTKALVLKDGRVDFHGNVKEGIEHYHAFFGESEGINLEGAPRSGDGRARISDVWFSDTEGNRLPILKSGQEVQLHIAVNPVAEKCSNLILAAGITTLQGEGVLHLSTETGGLPLPSLDTATVLTCTIPRLTLRGGYYSMNLFLSANGTVTDWLQGGYRFQIEDADFYRTGKLPPEGYSTFLADFSWAIAKE
ncbi:ABC transporter ATP-binding protein [Polynucleobacter sp. 78F-HAINBA]|uniref:ABC transporter ATP-binding protein n=1 Tax=Polynucleobacter sp. 78F-HAINBA TaxID=2689099 RepID=UPI001C0D52DD|nr:ABC transporter ATP-binding protein [Polynucleobacter sp. 78F-HAINBA]